MKTAVLLAWLDVPITATASGAVGIGLILLYKLITDRSAINAQIEAMQHQIETLERELAAQGVHLAQVEGLYDEQRGLKHQAFNDVARALTALELVKRLATECTCGVLTPLASIIERILDEMETVRRRRLGLHDEG